MFDIQKYHDEKRMAMSDYILVFYYKIIRHQCKYGDRSIDTLLEYINEMEYRNIKWRL